MNPPLLRFIAFSFLLAGTAPLSGRDLLPERWFENVEGTDDSLQKCLVFRTSAGVAYRVESSADLSNWELEYEVYGLGHEFVVPLHVITPPAIPGGGEGDPVAHVSLQLRPATGGGTVVAWKSLDHGGPVVFHIDGEMDAAWQTVPMFAALHGSHYFFVSHPPGSVGPPMANPVLESSDAAMIAVLEDHLDEMNVAVAGSDYIARNSPLPAPPTPGSRHFFRIHADWSVDTDGDGSPDWAEFEMAGDSQHPFHAMANPFDADADDNQVADGNQMDRDNDQMVDALDIAKADPTVVIALAPEQKYALFPISAASVAELEELALQINDRGTVLYANGTWSGGKGTALEENNVEGKLRGCRARGINDLGEIVGFGEYQVEENNWRWPVVYWTTPTANPTVLQKDDFFGIPNETMAATPLFGPFISNDGKVVCGAAKIEVPANGGDLDLVYKENSVWTLPRAGTPMERLGGLAAGLRFVASGSLYWGTDLETGKGMVVGPGNPGQLSSAPQNIVLQGGVLTAFFEGPNRPLAFQGGGWQESESTARGIDMSSDGTVIAKKENDQQKEVIRINGRWLPVQRTLPLKPGAAGWSVPYNSISLVDTSPGGWILARDKGSTSVSAAMLPLKIEGNFPFKRGDEPNDPELIEREGAGVDDFSVGATTSDLVVQDRLWIMLPKDGGETQVKVSAPLHSSCPLEMSGNNLKFGQADSFLLSKHEDVVTVKAGPNAASGSEIVLDLKLGSGASAVPSESGPIGFKVMKRRTVKVAMYKVTEDGDPDDPPDLVPTEAKLEKELNRIFTPQLNVVIDVIPIEQAIVVNWDPEEGGNGVLDLFQGQNDYSAEQNLVLGGIPNTPAPPEVDIRLFLIGKSMGIRGWTNRLGQTCWVQADLMGQQVPNLEEVIDSIRHEIGHIFVGYGHPDDILTGVAPLKGTIHAKRLMVSGPAPGPFGRLLVKGEWDEAEKWLHDNID